MNTSLIWSLIVIGIVGFCHDTVLAAPDAPAPSYCSAVTFEVFPPPGKDAEQLLRTYLPKDDPSVTLERFRTLFRIVVTSADPNAAAKHANEIAFAIQTALGRNGDRQRLKIWEKAEPALAPMAPKGAKQ